MTGYDAGTTRGQFVGQDALDRLGIRIIQTRGRFIQKQNGRVLHQSPATAARCCCPPIDWWVFFSQLGQTQAAEKEISSFLVSFPDMPAKEATKFKLLDKLANGNKFNC